MLKHFSRACLSQVDAPNDLFQSCPRGGITLADSLSSNEIEGISLTL